MLSTSPYLVHIKRIGYLSPMRAAKVQASLRICAVLPEPPLLAHTSSESRGIFRQKARSLAPLNGWASAVKICHDWMLEDTNSLGVTHLMILHFSIITLFPTVFMLTMNYERKYFMTEYSKKKICSHKLSFESKYHFSYLLMWVFPQH